MTETGEDKLYGADLVRKHGLWTLVREDYVANNRDWTEPGFRAVAIYRFGVWRKTVNFWPLRKAAGLLYKLLYRRIRNNYGIELQDTAMIGRRLRIAHQSGIVIHAFATIGDDCIIRQGVTLGAPRGGAGRDSAPRLGDRVQIGAGSVILGKVKIGNDVKMGCNVVVRTDIEKGSLVLPPPPHIVPGSTKPYKIGG